MAASSHEESLLEESTDRDDSGKEQYGVRDVTLFLIDASLPMFTNTNEQGEPYFLESLKMYADVLSKKLLWNRYDWMGLILFGTEKWDTDPEVKNVLTIEKLSLINIDQLIRAREAVDKWESYKAISSSTSYPLRELFWHITLCFSQIKVVMPLRRVILFTCQDNPPGLDENDKHSIRERAATFNNIDVQLFVFGLGKNWNHDIFYKDLEMLSGNISSDDYERISDIDLMQHIRLPSHVIAKVPWRIGKDVKINVQISNVCAKSKNLTKMNLSSETNQPLVSYTYHRIAHTDENEDYDEDELILETEMKLFQKLGGETICFTPESVKNLRNICDVGMDLICVKPLNYDPMYHVRAPYFVRCNKQSCKDEKLLFGAILNECEKKGLMMVVAFTPRKVSSTHLYNMIPSLKDGGFYIHKIPYENEVRNLDQFLSEYIYNNSDKKAPIDKGMVVLFEELIKKAEFHYNPDSFPNPRLQRHLQYLEALALKLEPPTPAIDPTIPMIDNLKISTKEHVKQINELDEVIVPKGELSPVQKKRKVETFEGSQSIEELVKRRKVDTCTVTELRNFLKEAGIKTGGKKADLVERIYNHFSDV